jgi:hypothetical protein
MEMHNYDVDLFRLKTGGCQDIKVWPAFHVVTGLVRPILVIAAAGVDQDGVLGSPDDETVECDRQLSGGRIEQIGLEPRTVTIRGLGRRGRIKNGWRNKRALVFQHALDFHVPNTPGLQGHLTRPIRIEIMNLQQKAAGLGFEGAMPYAGRAAGIRVGRIALNMTATPVNGDEIAREHIHLFPEFMHDRFGSAHSGLKAHQTSAAAGFPLFVQVPREDLSLHSGRKTRGSLPTLGHIHRLQFDVLPAYHQCLLLKHALPL